MKRFLIFLLTATFLFACNRSQTIQTETPSYPNEPSYPNAPSYPNESDSDHPIPQAYAPQPGDRDLERGNALVENSELLVMESYPLQITLVLEGELPTPCNQLRAAVNLPDKQNRIRVEVYSVIDPGQICVQVEEPFEVNVGLGSFPSGNYTVWVNGEMVGEFDS